MTCGDFKMEFHGKVILAFVTDDVTQLFKFESRYITFFLRRFIDDKMPYWRHMYFYEVDNINVEITKDGKISKFEDKAKFLFTWAKRLEQTGGSCCIRRTATVPNFSLLEGNKAKVLTLKFN